MTIEKGELFGLLGPNGAGKTTLTKILSTVLMPTSGKAVVLGHDVITGCTNIRPRIGLVLGGERGLYYRLSGRDNLQYFADLYHVPASVAKRRVPELLEMVGLEDRSSDLVETYSRGMKQRLHIARSLVADPELVLMDEPTIGLDPVAARAIRTIIKRLNSNGKTILLATHYMHEADELCQRVAVLHRGRVLAVASPDALRQSVAGGTTVHVLARRVTGEQLDRLRRIPRIEITAANGGSCQDGFQRIVIYGVGVTHGIDDILCALSGAQLVSFRVQEPTLEDAYVKLVGGDALRV